MNTLAIPQPSNITHLHNRICVHCGQKPVYAPNAIYCGTSCTNKAYRARKREKAASIAQEHTQTSRVEQLIAVMERQAEQIAELTNLLQKQPGNIWKPSLPEPIQQPPQASAAAKELLEIKPEAPNTEGGRNLLTQLLEATQTDFTTISGKKQAVQRKKPANIASSPKPIKTAQTLTAPNTDDLAAQISI